MAGLKRISPKHLAGGAALVAALLFGASVAAQEAPAAAPPAEPPMRTLEPDPDRVYAIVDGVAITEADLAAAAQDYERELGEIPADVRVTELLNVIIDMRLLAKAAEDAGIDKKEDVARLLVHERQRTLRDEYLRDKATTAITEETVKARFDKEIADFVPADELHLHHILVATEDEAKTVVADLDKGGDFSAIAKERSTDPGSGSKGGDLGYIAKGQTVPEFESAAFALEVGAYTKVPVQSQFGWHVIRLDEKRKEPPPALADEERRIRGELIREFVQAEVDAVRADAKIEIVPPPEEVEETAPEGETPAAQ